MSMSMDVDSIGSEPASVSVPVMKELASPPLVDAEDANSSPIVSVPKDVKPTTSTAKTNKVFDKQPLHKLLEYLIRVSASKSYDFQAASEFKMYLLINLLSRWRRRINNSSLRGQ